MKKRIAKKIVAFVISTMGSLLLPCIILVLGLVAVYTLVDSIIMNTGVEAYTAGDYVDMWSNTDLSAYDLDKMIEIAQDPTIFTAETLDYLMMERSAFVNLLKKTKEYNTTFDTAKKTIGKMHYWYEDVEEEDETSTGQATAGDEQGQEPTKKTKTVRKLQSAEVDSPYKVSAADYEDQYYQKIMWQSLYIGAIGTVLTTMQPGAMGDTQTDNGTTVVSRDDTISNGETKKKTENGGTLNSYEANAVGSFVGNWRPVDTAGNFSQRYVEGEAKYRGYVDVAASKYGIPADMIKAVINHESGWNPNAKNRNSTAGGLGQFLDGTWQGVSSSIGQGWTLEDKFDPEKNIEAIAYYLRYQLDRYDWDAAKAFWAYGIGNCDNGITAANQQGLKWTREFLFLFTGLNYSAEDLIAGNYENGHSDGLYHGVGSISKNGRLVLTNDQIDFLIAKYRTRFTYTFDVVRDAQEHYSFSECKDLPNYGKKKSGSDDDWYEWYEPVSQLDLAETPWMDVIYDYLNKNSSHIIRMDRWGNNLLGLCPEYDNDWYNTLVEILPCGEEVWLRYDMYCSSATNIVPYDEYTSAGNSFSSSSGDVWAASGDYAIPDGYSSIQIPTNAGGLSIPLYTQWDSKWGSIPFGGGTISSSGCGATSMAMIVTYLTGRQVTPDMIVSQIGNRYYVPGAGQSWEMPNGVASIYGLTAVYTGTVNAEMILKYLKQGLPVLVTTTGKGTKQIFTSGGHYIVLRGLDNNGRVLVNDPNDKSNKTHYLKSWDVNTIVAECYDHSIDPTTGRPKGLKQMWVYASS